MPPRREPPSPAPSTRSTRSTGRAPPVSTTSAASAKGTRRTQAQAQGGRKSNAGRRTAQTREEEEGMEELDDEDENERDSDGMSYASHAGYNPPAKVQAKNGNKPPAFVGDTSVNLATALHAAQTGGFTSSQSYFASRKPPSHGTDRLAAPPEIVEPPTVASTLSNRDRTRQTYSPFPSSSVASSAAGAAVPSAYANTLSPPPTGGLSPSPQYPYGRGIGRSPPPPDNRTPAEKARAMLGDAQGQVRYYLTDVGGSEGYRDTSSRTFSAMGNGNTSANMTANSSLDRTGHDYAPEDAAFAQLQREQAQKRQMASQNKAAAASSKANGAGRGQRTTQIIHDAAGRKRSRQSIGADNDAYRPDDDERSSDAESAGEGVVLGGAVGRRTTTRGMASSTGVGVAGAGLRARNARTGRGGEETDEGIGASEEEQERYREKSRSPFPQMQDRHRSTTPQPPLQSQGVNHGYATHRYKPPSQSHQIASSAVELAKNFGAMCLYFLGLSDCPDDGTVNSSRIRKGRVQSTRAQRVIAWSVLLALALSSYRMLHGTGPSAPGTGNESTYRAPHVPPGSLDELVERLTEIEHAVSAIGSANAVLKQNQHTDDDRLKRIESSLPDIQQQVQAHLGRLDRMESQQSAAHKEANAITDALTKRLGEVERDLQGLPASVRNMIEQQTQSQATLRALQTRLEGVEKELKAVLADGKIGEALQRVLPDLLPFRYAKNGRGSSKGGRDVEIDPTFWVELRKVLVGKDELGESVRRVLRDEVDAGSIGGSSGAKGKNGQGDQGQEDERRKEWERLEAWKTSLLEKLEDYKSPSIPKERFAELFEENALGLKGAIDELRSLVAAQAASSSSSKSKSTSGSGISNGASGVTYQLNTSEDITSSLTSLIDAALLRYSKDTIARPDYALYSAGARVLAQITTPTLVLHQPGWINRAVFGKKQVEALSPAHALMPGNTPGQCWSFRGQEGQLGVMLKERVVVGDVTVEHAPRENVGDVGAAPREVEVWGLVETQEDLEKVEDYYRWNPLPETASMPPSSEYLLLSTFEYDTNAPNHIQTFPVPRSITELGIKMGVVIWKFKSNWGSEDYTCLYRVRVHGVQAHE